MVSALPDTPQRIFIEGIEFAAKFEVSIDMSSRSFSNLYFYSASFISLSIGRSKS